MSRNVAVAGVGRRMLQDFDRYTPRDIGAPLGSGVLPQTQRHVDETVEALQSASASEMRQVKQALADAERRADEVKAYVESVRTRAEREHGIRL